VSAVIWVVLGLTLVCLGYATASQVRHERRLRRHLTSLGYSHLKRVGARIDPAPGYRVVGLWQAQRGGNSCRLIVLAASDQPAELIVNEV
jgi:hypothetical protein